MILDNLKRLIDKQNKTSTHPFYFRNILKEEVQNFILQYIYNAEKYKNLIFTGGTCLRKIYGLPRLSEDLDFDFVSTFDIEDFAKNIRMHFISNLQYENVDIKVAPHKRTVFLKFPALLADLGLVESRNVSTLLFVRCDFSEENLGVFNTEVNSISTSDYTIFVKNYDLPTLFANKIHAFLTRDFFKGKGQELSFKGRDVFDIVWFIERSKKSGFQLKPNWERLRKEVSGKSAEDIINALVEKAQKIDSSRVYQDLAPFIESEKSVKVFCESFATIIGQESHNLI